jgi:hypothetical protein
MVGDLRLAWCAVWLCTRYAVAVKLGMGEQLMAWWIWTLVGIYVLGFVVVFVGHLMYLQMVTPGLALLRATAWFIWIPTGWPHGVPLTMD